MRLKIGNRKWKTCVSVFALAAMLMVRPMISMAADVSGGNAAPVNTQPPNTIPQPMIQISSKGAEGALVPGQEFLTEITFKNKGTVTMERPVVTLTPSENVLTADNNNSSYEIRNIQPGKTETITLKWKMADKPGGSHNEIGVAVKFYYDSGFGLAQGSDTGKILLSGDQNAQTVDAATPNIIIKSFAYGGEPVAAGDGAQVKVAFFNTSSNRKIENLVVSAQLGEGLSLDNSSNTFYYKAIGAGKEQEMTLPLKVSPTIKDTSAGITFQFKYEYVDNEKRTAVTSSQTIALPVYQKDRFTILETILPQNPQAGEEQSISVKYVNEGKGNVSNVKAELLGGDQEGSKTQYFGNFESGKSGSISFLVTPNQAGVNSYKVKITYEDANMEQKELEVPIVLEATEPASEPEEQVIDGDLPGGGNSVMKIAAIGGGSLAAVLAAFVVFRKWKKKKTRTKRFEALEFTDQDDEFTDTL